MTGVRHWPITDFKIADNKKVHTWSLVGPLGMLVSINLETGEHTFGEHYSPDEAAQIFWEAVGSSLNQKDG